MKRQRAQRVIKVRAATAQYMCRCGHWANRHDSHRAPGACIYCKCSRFASAPALIADARS